MTDDHSAMSPDDSRVTLRFVPQTWIHDYAVEVDPVGPLEWTVSRELLLAVFASEDDWHSNHDVRDNMRVEGTVPTWVREWSGPFEVELVDDPKTIWVDRLATGTPDDPDR